MFDHNVIENKRLYTERRARSRDRKEKFRVYQISIVSETSSYTAYYTFQVAKLLKNEGERRGGAELSTFYKYNVRSLFIARWCIPSGYGGNPPPPLPVNERK